MGDQDDELATPNAAASLAVLAGTAASDAVCCAALGRRPRGQDHRQAADLLTQVVGVSHKRLTAALRQARHLVEAAERFIEDESP